MSPPYSNPDRHQGRLPRFLFWLAAGAFFFIIALKLLQGIGVLGSEAERAVKNPAHPSQDAEIRTVPVPDTDSTRFDHPAAVERRLLASVRYLAADELEGRGLGTAGIELAATYIADEFRHNNLRVDHYQGTPFQRFSKSSRMGMNGPNGLRFREDEDQSLMLRRDFTPLSFSGSGEFDKPTVFVGYGITAPEHDYDDYAQVEVRGKTVLVLRHTPTWLLPAKSNGNTAISKHGHLASKIANAVEHGAAAIVFYTDIHTLQERMSSLQHAERHPTIDGSIYDHDKLLAFTMRGSTPPERIPVVHVLRRILEEDVRKSTGIDLALLEEQIDQQQRPQSCLLSGFSVRGRTSVGPIASELKNVVATLEGFGPRAEETIVVGAHYDHLGHGNSWASLAPATRAVHNGADDNASGIAVMLELARQLAARNKPLNRRLVFLAFTAEESGLVGSQYYADHPLVPLNQTVTMLNFDMVGYLRNSRLEVFGTRTAFEFEPLLESIAHTNGFELLQHPNGDSPSDHAPFNAGGVPVLHFFTGFHDHYHRPSDDYDRLNYRGMRRITALARDLIVELANGENRPRIQMIQDSFAVTQWPTLPQSPNRRSSQHVSLGITGQVLSEESGYRVLQVEDWGLARTAGIRQGDRIVEIDARKIVTESDYSEVVSGLQPGIRIPVVLWRGEVELEIELVPQ